MAEPDAQAELWDAGQEDESDLKVRDAKSFSDAVVTATDWTTETILSQLRRGNILLNPRFQRRDAWTPERKSSFIESLLLGLPIPQLVLAEQKDRRGSYLVIDGKQRLLSLRQFAATETDLDFQPLKLTGLSVRSELNGKTLSDLESEPVLNAELTAFYNQTIRTVVVRNWPNETFLYLVFLRLNTGSVKLSPQELRQALHPGPFLTFIDEYSLESLHLRLALGASKPDFRMRDVELAIRFFGFRRFLHEYQGNLKEFLDYTCWKLNSEWGRDEPNIRADVSNLESAIQCTVDLFGDNAFKLYSDGKFYGRFNRAVFDVMTYYFGDSDTSTSVRKQGKDIVEDYIELCSRDADFRLALQATTKSVQATSYRLSKWRERLTYRGIPARTVPL